MHALQLYATGSITIAAVRQAKASKTAIKLPAIVNPITGTESARASVFGSVGWRKPTTSFYKLCNRKVNDADMEDIINKAKALSRASRRNAREAVDNSDGESIDPDDEIANLGDGSEASSDEGAADGDYGNDFTEDEYDYENYAVSQHNFRSCCLLLKTLSHSKRRPSGPSLSVHTR